MKILFICQCNICRSPMAEFILKHMTVDIPGLEIASAAISGEKEGCDINEHVKECLLKHAIPFTKRKAKVFELKDYFHYDLIICMDEWNKHNIKIHCLSDPDKKVYKLLEFSNRNTEGMSEDDAMIYTNIFDPYHSKDFERAFSEIFEGCEGLKKKIQGDIKNDNL